jgi:hypothetical protein
MNSLQDKVTLAADATDATDASMLAGKGMDQAAAARAATSLLGKAVSGQATVIAFDSAFSPWPCCLSSPRPCWSPSRLAWGDMRKRTRRTPWHEAGAGSRMTDYRPTQSVLEQSPFQS